MGSYTYKPGDKVRRKTDELIGTVVGYSITGQVKFEDAAGKLLTSQEEFLDRVVTGGSDEIISTMVPAAGGMIPYLQVLQDGAVEDSYRKALEGERRETRLQILLGNVSLSTADSAPTAQQVASRIYDILEALEQQERLRSDRV